MRNRRCLVAGGSGFIGRHLVGELVRRRCQVTVLDLIPPEIDSVSYVRGSVLDCDVLADALKESEYVFNLASPTGVASTDADPSTVARINTVGVANLLKAAIQSKAKEYIFTSSSEVYGEPGEIPVSEKCPTEPKSYYGLGKLLGERIIIGFSERADIRCKILRLFNVYGPDQSDRFVIPHFVRAATRNEDILVTGDGKQVRAFCHVDDAVKAIIMASEDTQHKSLTANVGNDTQPVSINQLAQIIIRCLGSSSKIIGVPFGGRNRSESREIFKRIPDISLAKSLFGYEPSVDLESGILTVANTMKDRV